MLKPAPQPDSPHPGINLSKIPVGGNVGGLLAALSIVIIGLIGLPVTRWFLAASLLAGALMALFFRWRNRA